jgi:ketosteroid isomerase-like protein
MARENEEIVRTAFAAFDRDDIDAVLRLCAEDILIVQPPELPDVSREQRGHRGVLEAFAIWPAQWEDYRVEILRMASAPADRVVVTTRTRGRGRQSQAEVEMDFSFVFTVRDESIREMRIFVREGDALEAAGLSG